MGQNPRHQRAGRTRHLDKTHIHNFWLLLFVRTLLNRALAAEDIWLPENSCGYRACQEDIQVNPGTAVLIEHREPEQVRER
jgi:hypothetical protein